MALSNAERQKRWRQKNRVRYNLNRRNKRRKNKRDRKETIVDEKPASKMDELRQLVKMVTAEPTMLAIKPTMYRDDDGRIITETQWNVLQKRKLDAIAGGYELDKYIQ